MAEGVMSPSDVAVMMRDNDGWGNGMGFMWIFALLILANGGFGGWNNNGFANAIGYENLATSNEVQRGFDNQNSMANQREILAAVNGSSLQNMQNSNQNTQYITGQVMINTMNLNVIFNLLLLDSSKLWLISLNAAAIFFVLLMV